MFNVKAATVLATVCSFIPFHFIGTFSEEIIKNNNLTKRTQKRGRKSLVAHFEIAPLHSFFFQNQS
jgi:hypothetical protein